MSGSVILPKNVSIDSISAGKVKTLGNGVTKMAYLTLNDENFILQLPEMSSPFGMSSWANDQGGTKYWIDLSFRDIENRLPLQVFKKLIEDIEEKVIQHAFTNSNEYFKKKYTNIEVVRALFSHSIKYPKDKTTGEVTDKWPPTFKVTLPQRDGEFSFQAYDKKKDSVNLKDIQTKGSKMTSLIQCGGIWIAGGKFGITWRAVQVQVIPYIKINGFAILDNPEDNITLNAEDEEDVIVDNVKSLIIDDDDDEDE
tara:strand:+ start:1443 stop:2204 length:762 start_codon:yes stop_codon:yes gene_type:complete